MLTVGFLNLANTPRDPIPLIGRVSYIADIIKQSDNAETYFLSEALRPITVPDSDIKVPWPTFMSKLLELLPEGWEESYVVANNTTEMSHGISIITNKNVNTIRNVERIQLSTAGFGSCGALAIINDQPVLAVQFPLRYEDRIEALQSVMNQIKLYDNKLFVLGDFNDFNDKNIELVNNINNIGYKSIIPSTTPTFATFPTDVLPSDMKEHVICWKDAGDDKINVLSSVDRVIAPINMIVQVEIMIVEGTHCTTEQLLETLLTNYMDRPSDHFAIVASFMWKEDQ